MVTVFLGIFMFTAIILALVLLILVAQSKLVSSGDVTIEINNDPEKTLTISAGTKLLGALAANHIFVSSACGGSGTCGQCKVNVREGGGDLLPTEEGFVSRGEARQGCRLSCQLNVKQNMKIELDPAIFGVKKMAV